MDWDELLANAQQLRSLKISMSDAYPKWFDHSQPTTNLLNLMLPFLLKLELSFVSLGIAELSHIFQKLPNLTNLKISYFSSCKISYFETIRRSYFGTTTEEIKPLDCEIEATNVFSNVYAVLPGDRYEFIELTDYCLFACPNYLTRGIRRRHNYTAVWSAVQPYTFQIKKKLKKPK